MLTRTAENPVQVDKSYFPGRRKYGKRRLLRGDLKSEKRKNRSVSVRAEPDNAEDVYKWNEEVFNSDEQEQNPNTIPSTNYGRRVIGPWIVGICLDNENVTFIEVKDRTTATLSLHLSIKLSNFK
eukprot:IDg6681t1